MDILDVAEKLGLELGYINGDEYVFHCPVHGDDKHPSLWLNSTKDSWFCFVDNVGGGIPQLIKFVGGEDKVVLTEPSQIKPRHGKQTEQLAESTYIALSTQDVNFCELDELVMSGDDEGVVIKGRKLLLDKK